MTAILGKPKRYIQPGPRLFEPAATNIPSIKTLETQIKPGTKRINNTKHKNVTLERLAKLHGWICWYCGVDVSEASGVKPHVDHMHPLGKDGSNHISNLAIACERCDRAKGKMLLNDYLNWLYGPKKAMVGGSR